MYCVQNCLESASFMYDFTKFGFEDGIYLNSVSMLLDVKLGDYNITIVICKITNNIKIVTKIMPKQKSRIRVFGEGIAGIFLFLFGLSIILGLYYMLTRSDFAGFSYGNPFWYLFYIIVAITVMLVIAVSSIYYGIRTIARN